MAPHDSFGTTGPFWGAGGGGGLLGATALDDSTIEIVGYELVAELIDPNFEGMFSKYELSGVLRDGTTITAGELLVQNDTEASFELTPAPEGDTNNDGLVNLDDLNNVRNNFGSADPDAPGDTYPFDGAITLDDLNAVRNNFGATGSPQAVPEPTGFALLAVGCTILAAGLSSRRRLPATA